jgi:glycosylphosphatidylinositol deacylase
LILALVALFVPWQVAFLGCWLVHLQNTAVRLRASGASFPPKSAGRATPEAVPLSAFDSSADGDETPPPTPLTTAARPTPAASSDPHAHAHVLLLLTWLLPLAAPVLAVWARTLATAGVGAPFGADHEVLAAAPYLLLVDAAFWVPGALLPRNP